MVAMLYHVFILVAHCRRLHLCPLEMILAQPDIETKRRIDTALRVLPPGWVQRVEKARDNIAWTLQTLSANALELSALWLGQGFHQKLLVDVASNTFKSRLPMEASDFEAHLSLIHISEPTRPY